MIGVSSITLAEIVYLAERGRIPADTLDSALAILADPESELVEIPFNHEIALRMGAVTREEVSEMPDRMVVATGLRYRVPIISRDGEIRAAGIQTIW